VRATKANPKETKDEGADPRYESRSVVKAFEILTLLSSHALLRAARLPLRDLAARYEETVSLAVLFENRIEVVHVIDSPSLMKMSNIVGRILPPHASSMGKAITAHLEEKAQTKLLQNYGLIRFTAKTILSKPALEAEYQRIREQGYSVDAEESIPDGQCFGAPILDKRGYPAGAISVSMPKSRIPKDTASLITAIQETAILISHHLRAEKTSDLRRAEI
jgi:DNA-binding IclR family transcriptional regulator